MANKMTLFKSVFIIIFTTHAIVSLANDQSNPQFSDFQSTVSLGPFANEIHLTSKQETYSASWKNSVRSELVEPANLAGHYRIFTLPGGKGIECLNEAWVCGWVIDKITGRIVSELPKDNNGSDIYASIGDNGTPVGYPFELDTYNDSSMIIITGQAIPLSKKENDNPICKSMVYNFSEGKFDKLIESTDGCNVED